MTPGKNSKILWAPWRMEYILGEKEKECIFCTKAKEESDQENLILHRGEYCYVIMNKYPYNNGHLMVVPYRHFSEFELLNDSESLEMMRLVSKCMAILRETFSAEGFNIGMNDGKVAGAGIEEHLHFHIVPRWGGDTNFMPVVSKTKVISEDLEDTWERFRKPFAELEK